MKCIKCGANTKKGLVFCPYCGNKLSVTVGGGQNSLNSMARPETITTKQRRAGIIIASIITALAFISLVIVLVVVLTKNDNSNPISATQTAQSEQTVVTDTTEVEDVDVWEPDDSLVPMEATEIDVWEYEYVVDEMDEEEIEKYISEYVRPTYYYINENIDMYEKSTRDTITYWESDAETLAKAELPKGTYDYDMARQYYYDVVTGDLIFAFVFDGTEEYRLYFMEGNLVRYIDEKGVIYNNPEGIKAREMGRMCSAEAILIL